MDTLAPDQIAADALRTILAMILPPEESCTVSEERVNQRLFVLGIHPNSDRATGIVMGKQGRTLEAIRRILTVQGASRGYTVNVYLITEKEKPNHGTSLEASAAR